MLAKPVSLVNRITFVNIVFVIIVDIVQMWFSLIMPKRVTKFDEWRLTDRRFSSWIRKSKASDESFCTFCQNSFSVANDGEYQGGQNYAKVEQAGKLQPKFEVNAGSVQVDFSDTKRKLSNEEQIAYAEILFVHRSVQHDHSFRSSDDLLFSCQNVSMYYYVIAEVLTYAISGQRQLCFFPQFWQPTNFRLNKLLMYGSHTSAVNFNMFSQVLFISHAVQ
jgi:hypothetical protein